ncbi:MAG: hypothetical protein II710_03750, partial [Clostridia bacterium]|nr:hypothetical protein [Clostridia bacterium]
EEKKPEPAKPEEKKSEPVTQTQPETEKKPEPAEQDQTPVHQAETNQQKNERCFSTPCSCLHILVSTTRILMSKNSTSSWGGFRKMRKKNKYRGRKNRPRCPLCKSKAEKAGPK